jgi:hypothetical protein
MSNHWRHSKISVAISMIHSAPLRRGARDAAHKPPSPPIRTQIVEVESAQETPLRQWKYCQFLRPHADGRRRRRRLLQIISWICRSASIAGIKRFWIADDPPRRHGKEIATRPRRCDSAFQEAHAVPICERRRHRRAAVFNSRAKRPRRAGQFSRAPQCRRALSTCCANRSMI